MQKRFLWIPPLITAVVFVLIFWSSTQVVGRYIAIRIRAAMPAVTTATGVSVSFPLGISFNDVEWKGAPAAAEPLLQIHNILMQPSLGALIVGRMLLSRVVIREAEVRLLRTSEGLWNLELPERSAEHSSIQSGALQQFFRAGKLFVHRLQIVDSVIVIHDEGVDPPVHMTIEDVRVLLRATPLPHQPWKTHVDVTGRVRTQADGSTGRLHVQGWFDPARRDVQATIDIERVELAPLHAYYQGVVARVHIYEGRLAVRVVVNAEANILDALCTLTLSRLSESDISVLGRTFVDVGEALRTVEGVLESEMRVTGMLDQPEGWVYALEPDQAPLILLLLPRMKHSDGKTILTVGKVALDVSEAVERWLGTEAPAVRSGIIGGINITRDPDADEVATGVVTSQGAQKESALGALLQATEDPVESLAVEIPARAVTAGDMPRPANVPPPGIGDAVIIQRAQSDFLDAIHRPTAVEDALLDDRWLSVPE